MNRLPYQQGHFHIYRDGELMATTLHAEDAAAMASILGPVGVVDSPIVVKYHGTVVYDVMADGDPTDSWDHAANIMHKRIQDLNHSSRA